MIMKNSSWHFEIFQELPGSKWVQLLTALSPAYRTSGPSVAGLETTYTGGNGFSTSYNSQRWLNLYLSACKFLDLALALPSENLPQFQM